MGLIAQVDGQVVEPVADEILPDDDDDHAGRSHVLLHACIDEAVVRDVAGSREEHGALVGHQHMSLGVGQGGEGIAVDGFIFADVEVVGFVGDVQVGAVGDVGIVLVLAGGNHLDLAHALGLGDGLLRPGAGFHIAGQAVLHEVHGHHGELQRGAALDEEHLVVVGDAHEVSEILLGLIGNLLKDLGAVGHFHDAHAGAAVVHHLIADLLQHRFGHGGRAGGEVVGSSVFHGY